MSVAADRFAGLMDGLGSAARAPDTPTMRASRFTPAARLLVRDGLHRGAWITLRGERLRLGSASDGDIVLTDAGMPPLAGCLVQGPGGWQLDTAAADGESTHGRWRRRRWQLVGVTLVVIDAAPAATPLPAARAASRRLALKLALGLAATLLVIASVVAVARIATPSTQARLARALQSLQALKLPDVQLRRADDDTLEVVGHVADAKQFEALSQWLQRGEPGDARVRVQQGTALVAQVREALGDAPDVKVTYAAGGSVRIEGRTRSAEQKRRAQRLAAEMREVARIDDQLVLTEDAPPARRSLPIDIVNVMQGATPYFQTKDGATYFIGSTMTDGAEVVAIDPRQIEFRLAERAVIYPLNH
jgi:BON domain